MSIPNNWGDWRTNLTPHTGDLQATDLIECTMIVGGVPINTAITGQQIINAASGGGLTTADRMVIVGRNSTGVTLYAGTIIYISGSTGNRPNYVKAQANTEATSAGTFGVIVADIANNSDGNALIIGTLDNLDTRAVATHPFTTDTLVDGDTLYLSPTTAGYVTRVKPSAPNHLVYIGKVVRTSPTNGTIVYRIQNGYELDEIHDVAISSVANNDLIQYDSATSLWKNRSLSTAGIQPTLVSGTSIKTINSTSLLGSGDIVIGGGGLTVGTTAIASGTIGGILFQNGSNLLAQDAALFWDNTNKRLGVGATPDTATRLDVRAQGALSTDIAFRVRNSSNTANIFQINGNGNVYSNGKGLVASNTAFGKDTLNTNTTGGSNVVLGSDIMQSSTTASANIAIGVQALYGNIIGAGNTAVGNQSLAFNTAGGNTAVGNLSSKANTSGSQNVAIGTSALTANQTGSDITAVGSEALQACTVGNNTSIGRQSSYSVTTGTGNTAVGKLALYGITTGIDNIHIGKNTGVLGITTGSYNTLIGGAISGLATTTANNVILADGQGNKVIWFDSTNSLISNIKIDTVTGVKIGTATTQKIGFWNATPIVQPTTAVAAATFVANTSAILNDTATFDGYTIGQVVKALRNTGILA